MSSNSEGTPTSQQRISRRAALQEAYVKKYGWVSYVNRCLGTSITEEDLLSLISRDLESPGSKPEPSPGRNGSQ